MLVNCFNEASRNRLSSVGECMMKFAFLSEFEAPAANQRDSGFSSSPAAATTRRRHCLRRRRQQATTSRRSGGGAGAGGRGGDVTLPSLSQRPSANPSLPQSKEIVISLITHHASSIRNSCEPPTCVHLRTKSLRTK